MPKQHEFVEKQEEMSASKINIVEVTVNDSTNNCGSCSCRLSNVKLSKSDKIGQIVSRLLEGRRYSKATIKLEVKFTE